MSSQAFFDRKKQKTNSSTRSLFFSLNERRKGYNQQGKKLMEIQPTFSPYYSLSLLSLSKSQDSRPQIIKSIYNPQALLNFLICTDEMLEKTIVGIDSSVFDSLYLKTILNLTTNEQGEGFLRWSSLPVSTEPEVGLLLVYNSSFETIGAGFKIPQEKEAVEREEIITLLKIGILESFLLKNAVSEAMNKFKQQPLSQYTTAPPTIQINMEQIFKLIENTPFTNAQEINEKLETSLLEKLSDLLNNLPDDMAKVFNNQVFQYLNLSGLFVEQVIRPLKETVSHLL